MSLLDKAFPSRVQQREVEAKVREGAKKIRTKTQEVGRAAEEALAIIAAGEQALLEKGMEETADLPRAKPTKEPED